MVNYNGQLVPSDSFYLNQDNRGLRFGDALFETIKVAKGRILFWEDHYFRLMASLRILRMEIPMEFTMEYLEDAIRHTLAPGSGENASARVRFTVFRKEGGLYLPADNRISYIIESAPLAESAYGLSLEPYEITLFRDYTLTADLLSNVKTNNKILNVLGSIYALENGYDNCLLLNQHKQIVEALNGNLFLVKGRIVKTPPLSDGCINGIMRKQILALLKKMDNLQLEEASVSPFELQNADEIFISNVIVGIQPVTGYRKAKYGSSVAAQIQEKLNRECELN